MQIKKMSLFKEHMEGLLTLYERKKNTPSYTYSTWCYAKINNSHVKPQAKS